MVLFFVEGTRVKLNSELVIPDTRHMRIEDDACVEVMHIRAMYESLGGERHTPGAEVLEMSPDGEAGASNLDRLQHARISELVQNQRLVELVRHLRRSEDGNSE